MEKKEIENLFSKFQGEELITEINKLFGKDIEKLMQDQINRGYQGQEQLERFLFSLDCMLKTQKIFIGKIREEAKQ